MLDPIGGDKKIKNLLIGAIKRVWHRHPTRLEVLQRVRMEEPRYRKDGSLAARLNVTYTCELCQQQCKPQKSKDYPQIHIDHKDPVIPIGKDQEDMTWDEFLSRLFCDLGNLQAICEVCHKEKTKAENEERRRVKKQ